MPDICDTTASLPAQDDWQGWVDILTRYDTGKVDCVPDCLLHLCIDQVGEDGRLTHPGMTPSTPYGVAKFMLMDHPLPWKGTGLTPDTVRDLLSEGISGPLILEAVASIEQDDGEEEEIEAITAPILRRRLSAADLYMIRGGDGPIKIGISVEPEKRLKALQTGYPYPLQIVCVVEGGGAELETAYHARFAAHRLHGEWFEPHPDILAEIERLND